MCAEISLIIELKEDERGTFLYMRTLKSCKISDKYTVSTTYSVYLELILF